MPRSKELPALTPRGVQVVNLVVNAVALGTHDNAAEIGAIAKQLQTTPARLQTLLRKLEEQGWITLKNDFVYPTADAIHWQNPDLSKAQTAKIVQALK